MQYRQGKLSVLYNAFYLTFLLAFLFWVISQGKYVVHKEPCVWGCLPVCVYLCVCICVLCLFEKYWKADWKPR